MNPERHSSVPIEPLLLFPVLLFILLLSSYIDNHRPLALSHGRCGLCGYTHLLGCLTLIAIKFVEEVGIPTAAVLIIIRGHVLFLHTFDSDDRLRGLRYEVFFVKVLVQYVINTNTDVL